MNAQLPARPQWLTQERYRRLVEVSARRQTDVSVVAENLTDPHNISALMRSADAFGIQTVDVIGQPEEFQGHPKTSSSAREWLTIRNHPTIQSCFQKLRSEGKRVYATRLDPQAKSIFAIDWTVPCAIVMGNEHSGVSEAAARLADEAVYIPMVGMVQSLNVSVATAVILAELFRQRLAAGLYGSEMREKQQALLQDWLERETAKRSKTAI